MVLTPQDIHNKEFSVKMRGYNIDQVNDFLDQIVKDYQITLHQNTSLKKLLREAQSKVKYFNNLKDSLNQSILVAQEAADKIKASSRKESRAAGQKAQNDANKLLKRAKQRADQIIQNSIHKANQLTVESSDLRKSTQAFRHKIQVMLESQLEFTKSKEWDSLLDQKSRQTNYQKLNHRIGQLGHNDSFANQQSDHDLNQSDQDNVVVYPDGTSKRI